MNQKTLAVFALLAVFAVGTLCASALQSGISACYTGRITGENLSDAQKYALGIETRFNAAFLALTADFTVRPDLGGADLFASANIRKTVGFLDFATRVGLRVGFGGLPTERQVSTACRGTGSGRLSLERPCTCGRQSGWTPERGMFRLHSGCPWDGWWTELQAVTYRKGSGTDRCPLRF